MKTTSLYAFAVLIVSSGFADACRLRPRCTDSTATLNVSTTNFDLSSGTKSQYATVPISGIFNVHLRFCEPTLVVPSRSHTLQVLVHGATYNIKYNDPEFEPDTYSYVHRAAAQGYPTLNMDRLGARSCCLTLWSYDSHNAFAHWQALETATTPTLSGSCRLRLTLRL